MCCIFLLLHFQDQSSFEFSRQQKHKLIKQKGKRSHKLHIIMICCIAVNCKLCSHKQFCIESILYSCIHRYQLLAATAYDANKENLLGWTDSYFIGKVPWLCEFIFSCLAFKKCKESKTILNSYFVSNWKRKLSTRHPQTVKTINHSHKIYLGTF